MPFKVHHVVTTDKFGKGLALCGKTPNFCHWSHLKFMFLECLR